MKVILLTISLFSISISAIANTGGWTSSGGEDIVDKNNPWFMGKAPVKWCIRHGGADKFSLPIDQARSEIEKGIEILTTQLKSINKESGSILNPSALMAAAMIDRKCGVVPTKSKEWAPYCPNPLADRVPGQTYMSEDFIYTSDCANADLEIILGDYTDSKVQQLLADIGEEQFGKMAGVAIRTEYSQKTLRSKGFIYIAADKGTLQYKSPRNNKFKNATIWDTAEKLNPLAPFPADMADIYNLSDVTKKLKMKDYAISALLPVFTHEFGHVLGLGHNHKYNIMDEDYPASTVRVGLAFKGNFERDSSVLSRGLIEAGTNRRIGFDWNHERIVELTELNILMQSTAIKRFIYNTDAFFDIGTIDRSPKTLFFDFNNSLKDPNSYDPDLSGPTFFPSYVSVATFEPNSFKFRLIKKYKFEVSDCHAPTTIERVTLRYNRMVTKSNNWIFDEPSMMWINADSGEYEAPLTLNLLSLDNNSYCGKIYLDKSKKTYLTMTLRHSYFGDDDSLELLDETTSAKMLMTFKASRIYGEPTQELPTANPIFTLSK